MIILLNYIIRILVKYLPKTFQEQLEGLSEVDREEVMVMVDRLNNRLNSVNVNISTVRYII